MMMMRFASLTLAAATVATIVTVAASAQPAPAEEQALYQAKCGGCHSLDSNRIGPGHRGIVGRKIATVPGYAYSPALKKLQGTWTPARLDAWLQGPQKVAPGSKMFLTIRDPAQRTKIIKYLELTSRPAPPK
ncbi:cytochrome c family protein [Sphingomonas sp.]|uniref:c-type cytochrome n=1 Tax=Sphingomonas sp. TaxID=28214 RepID=UPI0035A85E4B